MKIESKNQFKQNYNKTIMGNKKKMNKKINVWFK